MLKWLRFQTEKNARAVLIVSDDPATLAGVADALLSAGYRVHTANSGQAALEVLDRVPMPEAILCDFLHPETEGKQFLKRASLRFGRKKLPPILVLVDSEADETVARQEDADDVLLKPVQTELLLQCLHRVIAARRGPAEVSLRAARRLT